LAAYSGFVPENALLVFYFQIVGNTEIILAGADWLRNVDLSLVIRTADGLFLRHLAELSNWR
jgi:hypothetical protein